MASVAEVLAELRDLGSAQTAKTYRRHGASGEVYGVSYADLYKLKKRLKMDHALARDLWRSGVSDARVLATMVADPAQASGVELEGWLRDVDNYGLAGHLADVAAQRADAVALAERWTASDDEWIGRAGWRVLTLLAMKPDGPLTDEYCARLLPRIERDIHRAKNYVSAAMNDAVIAVGGRSEALRIQATAAAKRIGKVNVDHGDTACKTPDAAAYIEKIWARRGQRTK
ncbi:MAG TPA: DNA alkylation repair protein [Chloroflexota bacterium]|nr:DNA alkylation repair protein [Chloroflexota bacterium]